MQVWKNHISSKHQKDHDGEDLRLEDKERIVLEAMEKIGKPVRPGDVAKVTRLESKEVSKIIRLLRKRGKVISPKRCYYSLT